MVRPAIGGREGWRPRPFPPAGPRALGASPKGERFPRIRVSFGSRFDKPRVIPSCSSDGHRSGAKKKPLRSSSLGRGPIRTENTLGVYKGAPPRAADVSRHSGLNPRAVNMDCLFKPYIRCFRSSRSCGFLRTRDAASTLAPNACQHWSRGKNANAVQATAFAWRCAAGSTSAEAGKRNVTVVPRP